MNTKFKKVQKINSNTKIITVWEHFSVLDVAFNVILL